MPTDEEEDADRIDVLRSALELPFYLYEGPSFDDGSWFEACSRGLRGERIEEDQYSGEHYWLAQLRRHRWRVAQPSAALLFVVPLYLNAALQPSVKGASCNGTHFQVLLDATAAAVAATEQYARHDGADHIIVSNSWKLTQTPPEQAPWSKVGQLPNELFRRTFRNAIVGHMESHGVAKPPSSAFWRCSVVSPYVANYDEAAAAHRRPPASKERDVSFYFQGGANNRGTRGYAFRQAALPQLQDLPAAHISAFSLPGKPAACGGAVRTNCRAGRSSAAFRSLMARSRFNLVLRGDSPSSRRLYDGVAAGALSVLISDELWSVGLPFPCLVPWRKIAFTIAERPFFSSTGAAAVVGALDNLSPASLGRTQRLANRFRRDLIWNANGSRVAENLLITAALRCLPAHVVRRAAARAAALAAALRALRQHCPHGDTSVACVAPDASNCAGCETGDLASATPIEHCCADSCPQCRGLPARNRSSVSRAANRSASRAAARCVPADVYYGEPMRHDASRRGAIAAYLAQADKDAPEALQRWRKLAGEARPGSGGGSAAGRGRLKARGDKASGLKSRGRGAAAGSSRRP